MLDKKGGKKQWANIEKKEIYIIFFYLILTYYYFRCHTSQEQKWMSTIIVDDSILDFSIRILNLNV